MNLQTTNYKPASPAGRLQTKQGFSLIELLVTVAILVIVSGLVFFNQSGFNNSVLIENLAYEISLTVRQAQSYGLQSKETDVGGESSTFEAGYGVFFSMENDNELVLYADIDKDHLYDGGSVDEVIDILKMTNGNIIVKLCEEDSCAVGVSTLDIAFIRPNPTAYINEDEEIGEIYIRSLRDEEKKIIVNKIGQISIE